jgi:DNA polymerase III epsilon subunit-like protein
MEEFLNRYEDEDSRRKYEVSSWAASVLERDPIFLDLETTSLKPGKIVEISVISPRGSVLMNELVNPGIPISRGAAKTHGITNDMVSRCPPFEAFRPRVEELLEGRPCVIYNARYDEAFLEAEGINIDKYTFECLMLKFAKFHGEWRDEGGGWQWKTLFYACQYVNIPFRLNQWHNAYRDADAARRLLIALAGKV